MPWLYDGPNLYATTRWQRLRQHILKRDGFTCQMCGALLREGRSDQAASVMRPAVIDHLVPHKGDEAAFFDADLLWSVCCDCHDGACQSIEGKHSEPKRIMADKLRHRVVGMDGYPARPRGRWVDERWDAVISTVI